MALGQLLLVQISFSFKALRLICVKSPISWDRELFSVGIGGALHILTCTLAPEQKLLWTGWGSLHNSGPAPTLYFRTIFLQHSALHISSSSKVQTCFWNFHTSSTHVGRAREPWAHSVVRAGGHTGVFSTENSAGHSRSTCAVLFIVTWTRNTSAQDQKQLSGQGLRPECVWVRRERSSMKQFRGVCTLSALCSSLDQAGLRARREREGQVITWICKTLTSCEVPPAKGCWEGGSLFR